jgi:hypothetical protein
MTIISYYSCRAARPESRVSPFCPGSSRSPRETVRPARSPAGTSYRPRQGYCPGTILSKFELVSNNMTHQRMGKYQNAYIQMNKARLSLNLGAEL